MDAVGTMRFTGSRTPRFHGAIFSGRHSNGDNIRCRDEVCAGLEEVFNEGHKEHENEEQPSEKCSFGDLDLKNDGSFAIGGSILIRNSRRLEQSAGCRLVDVVESSEDPTDSFIVEQNSNLFDGNYFQTRQNPMYSSDQDLSEAVRSADEDTSKENNNSSDFKTTSSSKDWSSSVKVNDDHTLNGGCSYDVADLLADAPQDSITQKINVDRDEEVFDGPLSAEDEALLNTDVVSEKVDLDLVGGKVQVIVCVRCERTVPVYSMNSVFKKSSAIVTRRVQIDMECTETRRQLYATLQRRQSGNTDPSRPRFSTKDTFQLYKGFMGLVEANETARVDQVQVYPDSILSDDIDILKRPLLNDFSSASNQDADSSSRDHWTNGDLSQPRVTSSYGRTAAARESVANATPLTNDLYENRLVSSANNAERMTSFSRRFSSQPDSCNSYVDTEPNTSGFKMTSPFVGVSYSSLSSGTTRSYQSRDVTANDRYPFGEEGVTSLYSRRFSSDTGSRPTYSSSRFRSKSPFSIEDRTMTSSIMEPVGMESVARPSSRYERIKASRSRSPFATRDKMTSLPISIDDEYSSVNHDTGDFNTSRKARSSFDALRENLLPAEDYSYRSASRWTSRDMEVPDAPSITSRYSGRQTPSTSRDESGNGWSLNDKDSNSNYLTSRYARLGTAVSSPSVEAEEYINSVNETRSPWVEDTQGHSSDLENMTTSKWLSTSAANRELNMNDVDYKGYKDLYENSREAMHKDLRSNLDVKDLNTQTKTVHDYKNMLTIDTNDISFNTDSTNEYFRTRLTTSSSNGGAHGELEEKGAYSFRALADRQDVKSVPSNDENCDSNFFIKPKEDYSESVGMNSLYSNESNSPTNLANTSVSQKNYNAISDDPTTTSNNKANATNAGSMDYSKNINNGGNYIYEEKPLDVGESYLHAAPTHSKSRKNSFLEANSFSSSEESQMKAKKTNVVKKNEVNENNKSAKKTAEMSSRTGDTLSEKIEANSRTRTNFSSNSLGRRPPQWKLKNDSNAINGDHIKSESARVKPEAGTTSATKSQASVQHKRSDVVKSGVRSTESKSPSGMRTQQKNQPSESPIVSRTSISGNSMTSPAESRRTPSTPSLPLAIEDTWSTVADTMNAAMTSLSHLTATRKMLTETFDSPITSRSQLSTESSLEMPVCERVVGVPEQLDKITNPLVESSTSSPTPDTTSTTNSRRPSANSSSGPSNGSGHGSAHSADSQSFSSSPAAKGQSVARRVPSYALPTSSSARKTSTILSTMSRVPSNPALRDASINRSSSRPSTGSSSGSTSSVGRGEECSSTERRGSTTSRDSRHASTSDGSSEPRRPRKKDEDGSSGSSGSRRSSLSTVSSMTTDEVHQRTVTGSGKTLPSSDRRTPTSLTPGLAVHDAGRMASSTTGNATRVSSSRPPAGTSTSTSERLSRPYRSRNGSTS